MLPPIPIPITTNDPATSHADPLSAASTTSTNPAAAIAKLTDPTRRESKRSSAPPQGGLVTPDRIDITATSPAASAASKPCSPRNSTPCSTIAKIPTTETPKISTIR